jgi:pentatricopeptide repeat protein
MPMPLHFPQNDHISPKVLSALSNKTILHHRQVNKSNGNMKKVKLATIRPYIFSSTRNYTSLRPSNVFPPNQEDYITHQTPTTLSSALQHYINSDTPFHGQKIHTHILKTGFRPNINISIKLLILHLKCRCLKYAHQLFDELPQRTLSAYNYMIGGYLRQGLFEESISMVRRLDLDGERPDGFTFSMILKASTSGANVMLPRNTGGLVHAQILKLDVKADDVLYTALVDSYVKSGKVGYARKVFDLMLEKNVICSTSMISGYMNQGFVEDAEEIFWKTVEKNIVVFNAMIEGYSKSVETAMKALEVYVDMQRFGLRPNGSTFASVSGACSVLAGFEIGQQVQCQLMKSGFFNGVKMGSALIDMYSKCGRIEDARRVFNYMPVRNVFSWTSMIDGYGKNGEPWEALELFHRMQQCNIEPNYVTFLGALSACGHAGLVTKGREIFDSMERDYSTKPRMEHYACMVDLLGRAGNLQQAWELVKGMPEKPNSDVWAALLSSCNMHGNVEMARVAANKLFKINAIGRPGAYVALSNTLAAAERWDSVSELREMMKLRGISKDTACSWVGTEVDL